MKPGRVRVLVLVGLVVACLPSLVDAAEFPNTPDYNFTQHTDSVQSVAVDEDGYVYTASRGDTVRKINPSGGQVWSYVVGGIRSL